MSFSWTSEEHKPDNFNGGDDDKDGCGLFALLLFVVPMAAALVWGVL